MYLAECTFTDASKEDEVEEVNVSIEVDDLGMKIKREVGKKKEGGQT